MKGYDMKNSQKKTNSEGYGLKNSEKATDSVGLKNLKVNAFTSRNFKSTPAGSNKTDQTGALSYKGNHEHSRSKKV